MTPPGKPLRHELAGLYSIRAARSYRIIYRVERQKVIVIVVYIGLRDRVYEEVRRRRRRGDR